MMRFHRVGVVTAVLCVVCTLPCAELLAQKPDDAADARRLLEILKIEPGATVADIGAGSGLLTLPIARAIGSSGRIYATDINPQRLEELRQVAASQANVIVIEGGSARTGLPAECCDAIFMRHVYHHLGDPAAMNNSLLRSLKPGGRVVVVDFPPENGPSAPAGRRDTRQSHGVTPATVADELGAAGFAHVQEVTWTQHPYFAVAGERPN